jgi:hypothetical protein
MSLLGADYAFFPHPPIAALKAAGVRFVVRYVSSLPVNDTNGKNLLSGECKALLAAGIAVCVVAEEGASRMLGGKSAGVADAKHADQVTTALGLKGIPVYFACDFDASEANQGPINAYLDGAASVVSRGRTGLYGGYWPVSRALDAGKCAYAWQTLAWSGGHWDARANMRQFLAFTVGGLAIDKDTTAAGHAGLADDFGQWPRPKVVEPPVTPATPTKVFANGHQSWRQLAHAHGTTVDRALWLTAVNQPDGYSRPRQVAYIQAGDWNAVMPGPHGTTAGMAMWVG